MVSCGEEVEWAGSWTGEWECELLAAEADCGRAPRGIEGGTLQRPRTPLTDANLQSRRAAWVALAEGINLTQHCEAQLNTME
ncbi:hypothetical protein NDU88_002168 [Pleurodeles waltl]|uniref:Uncharacterized protein n=1 Tax=Pleurodeles waltl TaxID=8319 RepID=A0AAV7T166_PLEWA|nr:hypothetical protein NDU88_002168 [Pleurodeles waltl]